MLRIRHLIGSLLSGLGFGWLFFAFIYPWLNFDELLAPFWRFPLSTSLGVLIVFIVLFFLHVRLRETMHARVGREPSGTLEVHMAVQTMKGIRVSIRPPIGSGPEYPEAEPDAPEVERGAELLPAPDLESRVLEVHLDGDAFTPGHTIYVDCALLLKKSGAGGAVAEEVKTDPTIPTATFELSAFGFEKLSTHTVTVDLTPGENSETALFRLRVLESHNHTIAVTVYQAGEFVGEVNIDEPAALLSSTPTAGMVTAPPPPACRAAPGDRYAGPDCAIGELRRKRANV